MSSKRCTFVFLAALVMLAGAQCVWAQAGSNWNGSSFPVIDWTNAGNWDFVPGNSPGTSVGFADQTYSAAVNVDAAQTVGEMFFTAGASDWTIGGLPLTLDDGGPLPSIRVGGLAAGKSAIISANLVGTQALDVNPDLIVVTTSGTTITQYAGRTSLSGNNAGLPAMQVERGTLNIANLAARPAGQITLNQCGSLEATGAYATASGPLGWLASGKIAAASTGTLALTAPEGPINMAGYANLNLGAVPAGVTLVGNVTPNAQTYNLGGGGGVLTFGAAATLANNGGPTSANINGNVVYAPGFVPTYTGGTTINKGDDAGKLTISAPIGPITMNGGTLAVTSAAIPLNITNWGTFDGGISNLSDPAGTITLATPISGNNLRLNGTGTFNVNVPVTLSGEFAVNSTDPPVVNIASGQNLTAGVININGGLVNIAGVPGATTIAATTQLVATNPGNPGPAIGSGFNLSSSGSAVIHSGSSAVGTCVNISNGGAGTSTVDIGDAGSTDLAYVGLITGGKDWDGSVKIGGGGTNLGAHWGGSGCNLTLNIRGKNTTLSSKIAGDPSGSQQLDIGEGGVSITTANVYESAVLEGGSGGITVAAWDAGTAHVNMYDNSKIISPSLAAGGATWDFASDGTGGVATPSDMSLHDHVKVKLIGSTRSATNWSFGWGDVATSGNLIVAATSYGTLNIGVNPGDAPQVVAGHMEVAPMWWWSGRTGTLNIGQNASVHITNQNITTGDPDLQGDWSATGPGGGGDGNALIGGNNGNAIFNIGDNATLAVDNDLSFSINNWGSSVSTVSGSAAITVGHNMNVGGTGGGGSHVLNIGSGSVTVANTMAVNGPGTLNLSGTGNLSVGVNTVNNGVINDSSTGLVSLGPITGTGTLNIDPTTLIVTSVTQGTISIGAGSTLMLAAMPGTGPSAALSMSAVPEPSTIVMLIIAAMGLGLAAWRRK